MTKTASVVAILAALAHGRAAGQVAVGDEFQVSTYTLYAQHHSAVAMRPDGEFVVVWESGGYFGGGAQDPSDAGVFGQRFTRDGEKTGSEFRVNAKTQYDQRDPAVAFLDGGGFVVVWTDYSPSPRITDIHGRVYRADGRQLTREFQVNSYTIDI